VDERRAGSSRSAATRREPFIRSDPAGRRAPAARPGKASTGTGRARTRPAVAGRTSSRQPPPPSRPPRAPHTLAWRLRIATLVASVLVVALTGTAWGLYRDVTAGITTTDVISGGSNSGEQNILLVGVDSRTDAQGNPLPQEVLDTLHSGADTGVLNSDTIIVLHVPAGGGAAVAFSIPRDSYVDIPGYRTDKINAAYPAMKAITAQKLVAGGEHDPKKVETESAQKGRSALIGAVEALTGLTIDHYAEINLLGFYNLTKAIGGVDVCLKAPVNDELSGAHLPAGPQTISGADALAFVRQRHGLPEGDLSRIRRQQVFLAAVADKILSGGTLTNPAAFNGLIDVAQKSLVIDSGWDMLAFAQQASDIAAGNLEFLTIPTKGGQSNLRGDVVLVDPFDVRDFVEQRIAAQEATAEAAAEAAEAKPSKASTPPPAGPLPIPASRYVVDVRNGSATSGLAGDVFMHLRSLGFLPGTVDNTEATPESVVRYTGADGDAAKVVAEQLGGIATDKVENVSPGHLLVVLGADFDRAILPPSATPPPAQATRPPPPPGAPITAAGVPCID
jgi:LCP family protein required for cell wall assembly